MITEDYVSFETAKLLKEKGFIENCLMRYNKVGDLVEETYKFNWNFQTIDYSAPTLQRAMKWLREVYNIVISIFPTIEADMIVREDYSYAIYKNKTIVYQSCSTSYEQAVDEAIRYCLEKQI